MSALPIAIAVPTQTTATPTSARWPPVIWALLLTTFAVRAGGFVYPFLSYRLDGLHLTSSVASIVLAVFGAGWLVGQVLCGWLADRIGRRATLAGAMLLAATTFPVLAQVHTTVALIAAAAVSGAVYDAPRPVIAAMVADVIPDEAGRAKANGWRHFATNVGAATTGAVGGALAGRTGIPTLFWVNGAVCAVIAVLVLWVLPRATRTAVVEHGGYREAITDPRLWVLWLASLLTLIPVGALFSALPLMMAADGLDAAAYGWTQVTSAVAVVAISPLLNPLLARRAARPHAMVGPLALSGLVLGAGIGSAGLASTTLGYSAAAFLAVPGEIVAFVAAGDIVNRIAPPHARATYAGIWGTTLAAAIMCAPALAGWSLTHGGSELAALTTLTCGLLGAAVCLPLHGLLRRPHTQTVELP
ncbi:MFS transporter [Streptomyces sp. NBC_01571]|uniref:MFS transporter n=1 Tax=Streptomyces sp. NBC_01571 TaxID=2975883 RepID=UPI00225080CB|nr:MFS transporter [Streptomyces sp. NBC_01571]MCX4580996.1 MFS transporter [Streptomyces sp. NBC_01571]